MCILSEPQAMTGLLFFYLENNTRNTWQFLVSRGGLGDVSFAGNPYLTKCTPCSFFYRDFVYVPSCHPCIKNAELTCYDFILVLICIELCFTSVLLAGLL